MWRTQSCDRTEPRISLAEIQVKVKQMQARVIASERYRGAGRCAVHLRGSNSAAVRDLALPRAAAADARRYKECWDQW